MPRPDPRRVTAVSLATMVAGIAPVHLLGALAPDIQDELGFGERGQGFAVAAFFAVSAALSSWGGGLSDRVGPTRALRVGTLAAGAGAAIAIGAPSYAVIVVALGVTAVGNAINQPSNNTFIAGGVPTHRRGLALGIKQSAIPTSTGLAGLALPTLAATLGWRWAFGFAAALAAVAVLALPEVRAPATTEVRTGRFRPSKNTWLIAVGSAAGAAAVASIGAFLVSSLEDDGWGRTAAGLVQVGGSVLLISTRIGWGALMDRLGIDRFAFAAALLAVGALAYPLIAVDQRPVAVVGALLAYGAGWSWPGVVHLGTVEGHPAATGAASGVVQGGMFTGAMIGPALFGLLADGPGFAAAWALSSGFSALAAVLLWLARRRTN